MDKLTQLKNAVGILALPAAEQVRHLANFGHFGEITTEFLVIDDHWNIDELGLQFGDVELLLPQLVESGEITDKPARIGYKIGELLSRYSDGRDSEFWTLRSLRSDIRWEKVRQMAKELLSYI